VAVRAIGAAGQFLGLQARDAGCEGWAGFSAYGGCLSASASFSRRVMLSGDSHPLWIAVIDGPRPSFLH